jgi:ArsR family transcriptional regulator, cadmium/lead-responsive transcriptional repressor
VAVNLIGQSRASVDVDTAARLFHSLSDPTRLAILLSLQEGELSVGGIVAVVGSSQSNVSNHLACLKGCGLVIDRPAERRQVFYRIATDEVAGLLQAAERLLADTGVAVELCRNPLMPATAKRSTRKGQGRG